jgi:anti-sigma regulatory factor (Ser/Thr protein kinase)
MVERNWHFEASDPTDALAERHSYVQFLRATCTSDSDYDAAIMIFSELVGNVIRHAHGPVQISVQHLDAVAVTLRVADTGDPFAFAPSLPPIDDESGRGLYIVSELSSDIRMTRSEHGNIVRVRLPVISKS